jgi:hypothetical protein
MIFLLRQVFSFLKKEKLELKNKKKSLQKELFFCFSERVNSLRCFADPEHLCAAVRTSTSCCWLAVLHRNLLRIGHLFLCTTFNTVSFSH